MTHAARGLGWGLWGRWLTATLLGYLVGVVIAIALSSAAGAVVGWLGMGHPSETNLLVGPSVGAALGLAQVRAMRHLLPVRPGWALGTMIGFGVPFTVDILIDEAWVGTPDGSVGWLIVLAVAAGALAGLVQRGAWQERPGGAGRWTWLSALSFGLASACLWFLGDPGLGLLLCVMGYGAVSGASFVWVMRTTREPTAH